MKVAILFLDGVNIARSYLSLDQCDSITSHTVKNNRRSHDQKEPIGNILCYTY